MDQAGAQQLPGAAPQTTNASVAPASSQPEMQATDELSIISSFSLCLNQTLFAGNLDCLTATSIHDHPRRYLAVLVAQNNNIVGLFLFDPISELRVDHVSLKLDEAIDAIAIDSSTEDFVSFALDDNSFSLKSVNDSGLLHTYKFVCASSMALSSWRFHLLSHNQNISAAVGDMGVSGQTHSAQQEVQSLTAQLDRSSEIARTTIQKLSSMETAYKCTTPSSHVFVHHSIFVIFRSHII
jgi:hypothetical protein